MKVALCLFVVVLVVSIEALPQDVVSRIKRGFRNGAADRFSHGFGKRTKEGNDLLSDEETRPVMTVGDMVELLRSNPKLAYIFVKQYVDANGDGLVSRDEIFGTSLSS